MKLYQLFNKQIMVSSKTPTFIKTNIYTPKAQAIVRKIENKTFQKTNITKNSP